MLIAQFLIFISLILVVMILEMLFELIGKVKEITKTDRDRTGTMEMNLKDALQNTFEESQDLEKQSKSKT